METQILESTGIKTLKLIKSEAEMALGNIHQIDNEITKKSVNLMQVLFPLTVILIGYVIKSFTKEVPYADFAERFAFVSATLFLVVIGILYNNVLPKNTTLLGSMPTALAQDDLIKGEDDLDEKSIIINKISNLQDSIEVCLETYSKKLKRFKRGFQILWMGILFTLISSVLLSLS